jgi:hypothetical protein
MNDTEFIVFMKELILAPDSIIKKAHMERMLYLLAASQERENANERKILDLFLENKALELRNRELTGALFIHQLLPYSRR